MVPPGNKSHTGRAARRGRRACFATSGAEMMACHALSVNSFCVIRLPPPLLPPPPPAFALVASARRLRLLTLRTPVCTAVKQSNEASTQNAPEHASAYLSACSVEPPAKSAACQPAASARPECPRLAPAAKLL